MRGTTLVVATAMAMVVGVVTAGQPVIARDGSVLGGVVTAPAAGGGTWVRVGLGAPIELAPEDDGTLRLPALGTAELVVLNGVTGEPVSAGSLSWRCPEAPPGLLAADWSAPEGRLDLACRGGEILKISAPGFAPVTQRMNPDGRRHAVLLQPTGTLLLELRPAAEGLLWLTRDDRINATHLFSNVAEKHVIDASGVLEVRNLDLDAAYVGVAVVPGRAPVSGRFGGLPQNIELASDEGLKLSGTVLDEDGNPLAGATVEAVGVFPELDNFPYRQRTVATDRGSWTITGLLPGAVRVRACAEERACSESKIELASAKDAAPLAFTLAEGHDLLLVVENEVGDPIAEALVYFEESAHFTDERGRLEVDGVPDGTTIPVTVYGPGFGRWESSFDTAGKRVTLRVPGGGVLEQQVLTARTYDEHEVVVRWQSYTDRGRELRGGGGVWDAERSVARATGLEAGTYALQIRLPGSATTMSERVEVSPGDEVVLAPIVPERGLAISGRVLDAATYVPLAGARVSCEPGSPSVFREPHKLQSAPSTLTDAEGIFLLEGFDSGPCRVIVRAAGFATWRRDDVEPDDTGFDLGDIEVDQGMTIIGRVRDRSNRPLTGVPVEITEAAAYAYFPEATVRTNHDGWFRAERLPVGRWKLEATHDAATARTTVEGKARETVEADLVLGGIRIEGEIFMGQSRAVNGTLVLSTDGSQARGVVVMMERVTAGRRFFGIDSPPVQLAVTADGRFVGAGLEPGRYYASYTPPDPGAGQVTQVLKVPFVDTFRCVLQYADATVNGTVVDPDGLPVAGALVQASAGDGIQEVSGFTDADGRFSLRGLEPGRAVLRASHTSFAPSQPAELELGDGRSEGPVVLELLPPDGAEVLLAVHTASGSVGGAPVYLVGAETSTGFTDGGGLATFSGLSAGAYRPCGFAYGGATGCGDDLRVDDGDRLQADLRLGRGGYVDVLVGAAKQLPAVGVTTADGVDLSSMLRMASPPRPIPNGIRIGPLRADD
ncbi:MAG: carboxypeptidase regulatory-like domain-containing protein [Thermoanaerobaculales bacterium]